MKTRVLLTVSLITLFSSTVFAQQKVSWVTTNRMVEISFTSSRDFGNPFHDVTLDVLFDTPQGHTLKVPAFWDGGRVWKVRMRRQCWAVIAGGASAR